MPIADFLIGLAILTAWFGLALFVGSLLGRMMKDDPSFESQHRERVGIDPVTSYVAECRERDARARARHAGRKTA